MHDPHEGVAADGTITTGADRAHFGTAFEPVIAAAVDANRVFLRHYCVHLAGPRHHRPTERFAADRRAARGFNGDIAQHAQRWRDAIERGEEPTVVARRLARKTRLAVAGLVSVHDRTWTTNRQTAARRWALIDRARSEALETLVRWVDGAVGLRNAHVIRTLDDTVDPIADAFADAIGLWP